MSATTYQGFILTISCIVYHETEFEQQIKLKQTQESNIRSNSIHSPDRFYYF